MREGKIVRALKWLNSSQPTDFSGICALTFTHIIGPHSTLKRFRLVGGLKVDRRVVGCLEELIRGGEFVRKWLADIRAASRYVRV